MIIRGTFNLESEQTSRGILLLGCQPKRSQESSNGWRKHDQVDTQATSFHSKGQQTGPRAISGFYLLFGKIYTRILRFIVLHRCCVFLQIEGKNLHQQKDYKLLYCNTLLWCFGTRPTLTRYAYTT